MANRDWLTAGIAVLSLGGLIACGQNPNLTRAAPAKEAPGAMAAQPEFQSETPKAQDTPDAPETPEARTPEIPPAPKTAEEQCALIASLLQQHANTSGKYEFRIEADGGCTVMIDGTEERRFAPGTTVEIRVTETGVVVYIIRGPSVTETYYVRGGHVVQIIVSNPGTRPAPRINLSQQFHFDTGKSAIKLIDKPLLQALSEMIFDLIESEGSNLDTIEVQGHTDDEGTLQLNMELSRRRAASVRAALFKVIQANPRSSLLSAAEWNALIVAEGYGPHRPISGPSGISRKTGKRYYTRDDRELNRRVEFKVHRK